MNHEPDIPAVRQCLLDLQQRIITSLNDFDGNEFQIDTWECSSNDQLRGDGRSGVIEDGQFFERGGVNFSHVRGDELPASAAATWPQLAGRPFEALGVSLVLHPSNPYCPTAHINVRMFNASRANQTATCWFGGGMEPTRIVVSKRTPGISTRHAMTPLLRLVVTCNPSFKLWCADYFFPASAGAARNWRHFL